MWGRVGSGIDNTRKEKERKISNYDTQKRVKIV
jgi:hypothetical protein